MEKSKLKKFKKRKELNARSFQLESPLIYEDDYSMVNDVWRNWVKVHENIDDVMKDTMTIGFMLCFNSLDGDTFVAKKVLDMENIDNFNTRRELGEDDRNF